ncbi:hypothetical protein BTM231_15150 [Helicobacter pylori]
MNKKEIVSKDCIQKPLPNNSLSIAYYHSNDKHYSIKDTVFVVSAGRCSSTSSSCCCCCGSGGK